MSEPIARRLSWSIAVFSFLLVIIGLGINILARMISGQGITFSHQFFAPPLTITYCVVGVLVASRHPRNPIGWIFCATGLLSALTMLSASYALYSEIAVVNGSLPGATLARWLSIWIWIPNALLPMTFTLLLFPDGKLPSPRWRPIAWTAGLSIAVYALSMACYPGSMTELGIPATNPYGIAGSAAVINVLMTITAPFLLVGIFGSIASIVIRFRSAVGLERTQLKWLAVAGVIVIVGNILGAVPWFIWPDNPLTLEVSIVMSDLTIINIVIATGIAILRYRLWDIHILINRTLVYGSLTTLIVVLYVVIVGSLGTLLQTRGSLLVSLLGTGIIAISFQPMRERLQRSVNRLMYGERDDPYAVLGHLSERLEAVAAAQSVLPTIVETVAEAFKLPYAAVTLKEGEAFSIAAEYTRSAAFAPQNDGEMEILPLVYQSEIIGQMLLALRAPGEAFSQADRRLLETIARQAGIAAYNVRLTQDLQRSREQLVTTREEERRRLRRDLHDGLGPVLATISVGLDAIYNVADNPMTTRKLALEVKSQTKGALDDIRRIAYDLRPPALDEFGLVGALKQHIEAANHVDGLHIVFDEPEAVPQLPAAVEVAAYRIVLEAVTNVQRHAQAHTCTVQLSVDHHLFLEIRDDGCGLSNGHHAGIGLNAMRERAAELGGNCTIASRRGNGTTVLVRLPLLPTTAPIAARKTSWIPSAS